MDLRCCGVGFVGKGMVLVRLGTFYLHLEKRTFHTPFDEGEDVDKHWVLVYFESGWIVSTAKSYHSVGRGQSRSSVIA
jgi:hypothetical protein